MMYQPANNTVRSLFDLSGQVAAITGGVRGIGLAAAQGLAEAGCNVALIYNSAPNRARRGSFCNDFQFNQS